MRPFTAVFGSAAAMQHVDSADHRALIINGENAVPGRYPYFSTLDRFCAGALIAPDIVLTAGHCKPDTVKDIGQLHVGTLFFDYDRDAATAATQQDYDKETFEIVSMVRNEHFQRLGDDEFRHDFTILKLNGYSKQTPIRINRNPNVPSFKGQELVAMGLGDTYNEWADDDDDANIGDGGTDDRGPLRPDVLQQVTINYLPNEECRKASNGDGESYSDPPNRIGPTHLCTFAPPDNTRDACAYDSGGPIIIPGDSGANDVLVALVSWGIGCADPIFPAVNARVAAVSDWIDAHVCSLSDAPPDDFGCHGNSNNINPSPTHKAHWAHCSWNWILACLVLCVGYLVAKKFRSSWCARRSGRQQGPLDQDPSAWHFSAVKRRDTGETTSLRGSSDSDLSSYGSDEQP